MEVNMSESKPLEQAPPEWAWFLQALDQKLESLRHTTETLLERVHSYESRYQGLEQAFAQDLHQHKLDLKELDQSLQYLSHKTQLQLKDAEQGNERFRHDTEARVNNIHYATREELSTLARRVEILEKLIF